MIEKLFKPDISKMPYVTPCCSDILDENGIQTGYYVDRFGRKFNQNTGERMFSSVWDCKSDIPHVNIPREESVCEEFDRTYGEDWWKGGFISMRPVNDDSVVDVTFVEVKDDN